MAQIENTSRDQLVKDWESHFEMLTSMVGGNTPAPVQDIRSKAIKAFSGQGFPTTKNEEWKYSSVSGLLKEGFSPSLVKKPHSIDQATVSSLKLPVGECHLVVFVNGFWDESLSEILPGDNLEIKNLAKVIESNDETFLSHFARIASAETNAFTALNTAFSTDGIVIRIGKGKTGNHPVQILHISDTTAAPVLSQQRNLIMVEENAEASVYECFRTFGSQKSLTNTITEASVGQNGRLNHYIIQDDIQLGNQIRTTQIAQDRDSVVKNVTVSVGGSFIRNDLNYLHRDQHCESHLFGLYHLNEDQHVDNHTLVDHAQPNCYSNELYKGIMDGSSTGVFNGKVMVRQDAQKTNAFQSNRNLLLADGATINTKPQLEIFADDVKCSHGATTGRLDAEAMFYLQARGVAKDAAQALLTFAFAGEVLDEIEAEAVRESLKEKIAAKLNSDNLI